MCEYCNANPTVKMLSRKMDSSTTYLVALQSDKHIYVKYSYFKSIENNEDFSDAFKINYCPMCGRKL